MPELPLRSRPEFRRGPLDDAGELRDDPSDAFIEGIRSVLPTEHEVDHQLTRKMRRRSAKAQPSATLEQMTGYLTRFLEDARVGTFEVLDPRWFAGGASKIQMGFTLRWAPDGGPSRDTRLVVRMEPAESVNSTSRVREFELLRGFEGIVPVPHAYWVDAEGRWFPEPALIYAFCAGVTKPSAATTGRLAGIGTNFGPEVRARLAPQFVEFLARIHAADPSTMRLDAFTLPAVGSVESALWQLNRARRIWEEDRGADVPLMEVAASWLERNLPVLDRVSILHGDYRSGNFLFDERSLEITAVLDWERGYLGDRHRDLAWTANRAFGHMAEDGVTFLASGLMANDAFFATYEKLSGLGVDPVRLRYYTVLNTYQLVVSAIGSAYRVVRLGKTHQDILLASAEPVGHAALAQLRRCLEECL